MQAHGYREDGVKGEDTRGREASRDPWMRASVCVRSLNNAGTNRHHDPGMTRRRGSSPLAVASSLFTPSTPPPHHNHSLLPNPSPSPSSPPWRKAQRRGVAEVERRGVGVVRVAGRGPSAGRTSGASAGRRLGPGRGGNGGFVWRRRQPTWPATRRRSWRPPISRRHHRPRHRASG
jgi:hypothetical protein